MAFCRCWKSSTFPYCDGSHAKHNEECGDNCGCARGRQQAGALAGAVFGRAARPSG